MSKLEIEFELTGLRLKIKGDSDEVSGKVADLQRQVQGMMNTIGAITQGASTPALPKVPINGDSGGKLLLQTATETEIAVAPSNARKQRAPRKSGGGRQQVETIDFQHDAETYGFPKQEWTATQKAMWLLNVLTLQTDQNKYSATVIAATFNKHFKTFGTIRAHNVTRDLGKEKGKTGWVNSDASQQPETWYLLEAGKQGIAALIQEAKGQGPAE